MDEKIQNMIKKLRFRPAVSDQAIIDFEKSSRLNLPYAYKEFLKITNGGEGWIGNNSYVIFWMLEDLDKLNKSYATNEFAPGLLLFGSNGGGEAYAFDIRSESMNIVQVPFVGMDLTLVEILADTFDHFIEWLYHPEETK